MMSLLVLWCSFALAQKPAAEKSGTVEYATLRHKQVVSEGGKLMLQYADGVAKLWRDQSGRDLIDEVPVQADFLDFNNGTVVRQAAFMNGDHYYTRSAFQSLEHFKAEGAPEKILGMECQRYVGISFSNKIELWVAKGAGLKGSPMLGFTFADGLVLRYVRNDNAGWEATAINFDKKGKKPAALLPANLGTQTTDVDFNNRVANAFVKTVPVFTRQQVNWTDGIENPKGEYTDSLYRFAGGSVVVKRVKLPEVPDGTTVYVELTEQSNGDAYDRTGSVFVIPVDKKHSFLEGMEKGVKALPQYTSKEGKTYQGIAMNSEFNPLIELMRFFTPFGVHHFNDKRDVGIQWNDSVFYKEEVTELLPVLRGEVWIGVFVGNYDGGGHRVSLNVKYYLNDQEKPKAPAKKYWIQPVFNTTNVLEMAGQEYGTMFRTDTLKVDFEVPKGVKNVMFRYLTTGHGGWGGGDEYVPKKNELWIDGQPFFHFTPWRVDCGTYRASNPASGNFWNGITSSDGSRSGWCPGTVSHPYFTWPDSLDPGKHSISVWVPLGETDGGMFSAWNVSGVFIGEIEE